MQAPSWRLLLMHEAHEYILQRALGGIQIPETDAEIAETPEQRRHARMLPVDVELVFELVTADAQLQMPIGEFGRGSRHRLLQYEREALAAELFHQRRLV